ncbi:MAG: hypothetical protein IH995_08020 [Proteobacteria bacterium]|nr:hypothetical protein [Pseudomonadota bacterium]
MQLTKKDKIFCFQTWPLILLGFVWTFYVATYQIAAEELTEESTCIELVLNLANPEDSNSAKNPQENFWLTNSDVIKETIKVQENYLILIPERYEITVAAHQEIAKKEYDLPESEALKKFRDSEIKTMQENFRITKFVYQQNEDFLITIESTKKIWLEVSKPTTLDAFVYPDQKNDMSLSLNYFNDITAIDRDIRDTVGNLLGLHYCKEKFTPTELQ